MLDSLNLPQSNLLLGLLGILCLAMGRKLFWVAVAALGFYLGASAAQTYLGFTSPALILFAGVVAGIAGALLAVLFQKVAVALAGFAIGGRVLAAYLAAVVPVTPEQYWVLVILCGLICAVMVAWLFDAGLIVITSIFGAGLLVQAFGLAGDLAIVLFVALATAGMLLQFGVVGQLAGRPRG